MCNCQEKDKDGNYRFTSNGCNWCQAQDKEKQERLHGKLGEKLRKR